MSRRRTVALAGLLLCLVAVGAASAAQAPAINRWVISGGGGPSRGGDVTLNDTLGEPIIGPSGDGGVFLGAGYWYGLLRDPRPVGGSTVVSRPIEPLVLFLGVLVVSAPILAAAGALLRARARR